MDKKTMILLRNIQFEKCKGELNALVAMFDFFPTYDGIEYDSVSKKKHFTRVMAEMLVNQFIEQMGDLIS